MVVRRLGRLGRITDLVAITGSIYHFPCVQKINTKDASINWSTELKILQNLGCESQTLVAIAYHIYLELCEVLALWDVECHFKKELNMIYFTAKRSKNAEKTEIFVPHSASCDIDLQTIEKIQNELCDKEKAKCITLAIKHQDSTVVYYTLSQNMVPPDSPETARKKKNQQEKLYRIETEVRKQRRELFQQAMCKPASLYESSDEDSCSQEQ